MGTGTVYALQVVVKCGALEIGATGKVSVFGDDVNVDDTRIWYTGKVSSKRL